MLGQVSDPRFDNVMAIQKRDGAAVDVDVDGFGELSSVDRRHCHFRLMLTWRIVGGQNTVGKCLTLFTDKASSGCPIDEFRSQEQATTTTRTCGRGGGSNKQQPLAFLVLEQTNLASYLDLLFRRNKSRRGTTNTTSLGNYRYLRSRNLLFTRRRRTHHPCSAPTLPRG